MCAEDDQMMRGQSADDGGATMVLMMVWGAEVLMKAGGADVQWFTPLLVTSGEISSVRRPR